jgi:hypothetical protein
VWTPADAEKVLRAAGFVEVRTLPVAPQSLVAWTVGRKSA